MGKSEKQKKEHIPYNYNRKKKVSVWVSQHPYADIPDDYFEERFSHKNTRAQNTWSDNFKLPYFNPDCLEINGVHEGMVDIKKAAGECSFSSSYIDVLMSKSRKKKISEITWIVLLFDCEYTIKVSNVGKDSYLKFLGAFDYDETADRLYKTEEEEEKIL